MKYIFTIFFTCAFFTSFSQDSIYACDGNANLYTVNLMNCTTHFIGNTGIPFLDIGFTADGRLWGIEEGLYQIDKNTAKVTYVGGNNSVGGVALTGLDDTTLLTEFDDSLYAVNVKNVAYHNLGSLNGYSAEGDLSWLNNKLYMTANNNFGNGFVVEITLNNSYTSVISAVAINTINSLTPPLLGLITTKINGSDSLVGFNLNSYVLSGIDGSYRIECPLLDTVAFLGAASMSFPTILQTPMILTTAVRFKLTGAGRFKLTTPRRSKLTTC